jgi:hypothetical protein
MRGLKLALVAAIGLAGCGGARNNSAAPEVAGASGPTGTVARQGPVDLTSLDRDMVGSRAQVLVLGTVHLSGMPKGFKPQSLDPVLARLAAFKPDIITIEALSGEECDLAARHSGVYGADYCRDTNAAKAATGLDIPAAIAEANKALKSWPAQPTPVQRRRLAAVFLAANDRASAYVQWLCARWRGSRAPRGWAPNPTGSLSGPTLHRNGTPAAA